MDAAEVVMKISSEQTGTRLADSLAYDWSTQAAALFATGELGRPWIATAGPGSHMTVRGERSEEVTDWSDVNTRTSSMTSTWTCDHPEQWRRSQMKVHGKACGK